jgi:alpha-L-rhamnosidase
MPNHDISLNHIMFGGIGAWLYRGIGGIEPDEKQPGFKNVILKPNFVAGLNQFEASHTSPYGKIISSWKRNGDAVEYNVTIPANTTATITFPQGKKVYLDGKPVNNLKGLAITAGTYSFKL